MMRTILCVAFLVCLGHSSTIPLPPSTGPCNVRLHASELVDASRTDPYDPKRGKRAIMVTSFTPTACGSVSSASYFPNATATFEDEFFQAMGLALAPGTFKSFHIETQLSQQPSSASRGGYPVVLFSPAAGMSRLVYTVLLQDIASYGFAVVSVDHPHDANIVEFPDGRTVIGTNISTNAQYLAALNVRVKDMSFLLDQIQNDSAVKEIFPLSKASPNLLSLHRASIFGHSLGGATAAQTMFVDDRFAGASTWMANSTDPSWSKFWSKSRGWKLELKLAQSKHYTFSDFPVLVDALSISEEARQVVQTERTGTIGAVRAKNVITSGPSASFPDVSIVASKS
ncbi:PAF acetylhydrolase family protein [Penicillium chermesinum]|nr:PAF acetylhydrolase family protein [Penicillium chermesinum]